MTEETTAPATEETPAEALARIGAEFGLTIAAAFVPQSKSRNAEADPETGKVWRGLNWRVTLLRNGKPMPGLESFENRHGEAHAPAYKATRAFPDKWTRESAIALECETGKRARRGIGGNPYASREAIAPPPLADILWSLSLDASVLDHPTFESWASDYGYSTDSRRAESIYRACLAHALALRGAIGEAGIEALREAGRDY
jgi:hypothetical protein